MADTYALFADDLNAAISWLRRGALSPLFVTRNLPSEAKGESNAIRSGTRFVSNAKNLAV